jgi:hypothetical protein
MRGFGKGLLSRVLCLALCSLLFSVAAFAGDVHVLTISSARWRSDVKIVAGAGDVEMRTSDCSGVSAFNLKLKRDEQTLAADFPINNLCRPPAPIFGISLGVVTLPVSSGEPRVWTIATYQDDHGNFNNVFIPSLPAALAPDQGKYVFYGIESGGSKDRPRSTQIALIAEGGGSASAHLAVFDEFNAPVGDPITVQVLGWEIYTIKSDVRIGRVEMTTDKPGFSPSTPASLYAIAMTFDSRGGAPEVEVPKTVAP